MKLGLNLQQPVQWRETWRMLDTDGVRHMSLIVQNDDLDAGTVFIPCLGAWTDIVEYDCVSEHVTCIVCAQFMVTVGRISLWVP